VSVYILFCKQGDKVKTIFILILLTFQAIASATISKQEEATIINSLVESLEQKAWDNGHDNIESELEEYSLERLQRFIDEEHRFMEDKLSNSEFEDITSCIERTSCTVYKINIATEYYSGYGFDYHFVFLKKTDGSFIKNKYAGYNE
jgi:hypothetical protein